MTDIFPRKGVSERVVLADESELRLDRWFKRYYPGLAHGKLEKFLRTGQIRVDGKRASANLRLGEGQKIRVPPMPEDANDRPSRQLYRARSDDAQLLCDMTIYEDEDVIVLNKLAGLAVQGGLGIARHLDGMLVALADKDGMKPKLVHRLDRETSGLLLLARTNLAAAHFTAAFRHHAVRKIYGAVTVGVPRPRKGEIDLPLGKSNFGRMHPTGIDPREAHTRYQTVSDLRNKSALVALCPTTGRTHQLRAHLSLRGTPILGDPLYGFAKGTEGAQQSLERLDIGDGLHLHAWRLSVEHPRKGRMLLQAPFPPHMLQTFAALGFSEKDMADAEF